MDAEINGSLVEEVRGLVESYWRARLIYIHTKGIAAATELTNVFENGIRDIAEGLGPDERQQYQATVDAERLRILEEYETDPDGLKARLGILEAQFGTPHSTPLIDTAVRTAVRATVWESVFALFRAFR